MPEAKAKPKTLHQKLLEVQKTVTHLQKTTQSGDGQYAYVGSSQVLGAIREKMDEEGLLLQVQLIEHALHIDGAYSYLEKPQHFTEVVLEFTWVNVDIPDDRESFRWYGQGIDSGEKGVGKAYTYAEKYFLLKFLHVPTDKDDPDAHAAPIGGGKAAPRQQPAQQASGDGEFAPCPDCGAVLQVRTRKDGGQFVGCSGYPQCKFTCDVEKAPRPATEYDGKVNVDRLAEGEDIFPDEDGQHIIKNGGQCHAAIVALGIEDPEAALEEACEERFDGTVPDRDDISPRQWQELYDDIARKQKAAAAG